MPKKRRQTDDLQLERPGRVKLSAKESLKRLRDFAQRREAFVAAVRKGKNRSVSS